MKRFFLCLFAMMVGVLPSSASASETIRAFDSTLTVTRGDDAFIQERIVYDFGSAFRHGIYRNVPKYQCPGSVCVKSGVEFFAPTRDGEEEMYENSTAGSAIQQRIGDPVVEIDGVHEYLVRYTVRHGVVEKPEGQLVSWNVTGNDWEVPIELSTYTIEGPVPPTSVRCFVGRAGSVVEDCTMVTSGTRVMVTLNRGLGIQEGWTVDALYPAGTFAAAIRPVPKPPVPYWVIAGLLFAGAWIMIWWFLGRDAKGRGTIIPEYEPPKNLKPYEAEALLNDTPSVRGLTATTMDFARRGILKIETKDGFFGKKYSIVKGEGDASGLDTAERAAYNLFFGEGEVFELGRFTGSAHRASAFQAWRTAVNTHVKTQGWQRWNAEHARGLAIAALFVMAIAMNVLLWPYVQGEFFLFSLFGAVIAFPFAYAMPRMTTSGALLVEHLKGFKRYIKVAEKDRLAFHEAPKATPERFSTLLPFAVALNEEEAWAKLFEDVGLSPEQLRPYGSGMNALALGGLSRSITSSLRSSVSAPSSGSGGSSGGGGGGGGGGSW